MRLKKADSIARDGRSTEGKQPRSSTSPNRPEWLSKTLGNQVLSKSSCNPGKPDERRTQELDIIGNLEATTVLLRKGSFDMCSAGTNERASHAKISFARQQSSTSCITTNDDLPAFARDDSTRSDAHDPPNCCHQFPRADSAEEDFDAAISMLDDSIFDFHRTTGGASAPTRASGSSNSGQSKVAPAKLCNQHDVPLSLDSTRLPGGAGWPNSDARGAAISQHRRDPAPQSLDARLLGGKRAQAARTQDVTAASRSLDGGLLWRSIRQRARAVQQADEEGPWEEGRARLARLVDALDDGAPASPRGARSLALAAQRTGSDGRALVRKDEKARHRLLMESADDIPCDAQPLLTSQLSAARDELAQRKLRSAVRKISAVDSLVKMQQKHQGLP